MLHPSQSLKNHNADKKADGKDQAQKTSLENE